MKTVTQKFFKSFYYAGRGVATGFRERNMRFHGLAAFLVIILGMMVNLSKWEWTTVLILISLVWAAELFNTSIEELANLIRDENQLEYHATQNIRDLAAGAVLVIASAAIVIGLLIFVPKIIGL